jgi:glycerophosphoryl diester phosphodiesterase
MSAVRPLAIGHRGAPRVAPENTLASFEHALAQTWIDAVELDVHLSRDEKAVVIHDDTLDRTTREKGFVSERSAAELRALGLPMLEDVLALARERGKRVFVELKMQPRFYAKLPATVAALVRSLGVERSVVVISFDHRALVALKRAAPSIECGALCGQRLHEPARYVKEYLGVEWWLPGAIGEVDSIGFFSAAREPDRASFEQCRQAGVRTAVWTVNHPELMKGVLALGADGVISDDLELLRLTT